VHCHAFIREERQRAYGDALASRAASVTLHLLTRSRRREIGYLLQSAVGGAPYTVTRHFDAATHAAIDAAVRQRRPDLVYCDHLSMMEYGRRLDVPLVYDAHNVEHAVVRRFAAARPGLLMRLASSVEWRRVRTYERDACRLSRLVFAVSDVDRRALAELAGRQVPICTVPIAVDAASVTARSTPWPAPALLFLGGLHWPPNAEALGFFIRDIWPIVLRARPDATLVSVGRDDHPMAPVWRRTPGVTLTGWVEDIEPHVASSRVLVVPMRAGSGMRVKILEAMARGLPIVSTSLGCEGIDIRSAEHLLVADDPKAFAAAVLQLMTDGDLCSSLAASARRLALARYDVQVVATTVLQAIREVARDPAGTCLPRG
jgi:glycosyltransferase involved in cell wall biosynthesis